MGSVFGRPAEVHESPVVKGDTIIVSNCSEDRKLTVRWKDGDETKSAEYFMLGFAVKEKGK